MVIVNLNVVKYFKLGWSPARVGEPDSVSRRSSSDGNLRRAQRVVTPGRERSGEGRRRGRLDFVVAVTASIAIFFRFLFMIALRIPLNALRNDFIVTIFDSPCSLLYYSRVFAN